MLRKRYDLVLTTADCVTQDDPGITAAVPSAENLPAPKASISRTARWNTDSTVGAYAEASGRERYTGTC
jgi:riboflavin biosynthesis pyrimidine reductase